MTRGTFGNIRLKNLLVPGVEGGVTVHLPDGERMSIYDAALRYRAEGVPLLVIAGKEYGTGSSRDWAAKGPRLLGVRAVLAKSYERIHRSNLVGMGVLPLQFLPGRTRRPCCSPGMSTYSVHGLSAGLARGGPDRARRAPGQGRGRVQSPHPHRHTPGARDLPSRGDPARRRPPDVEDQ